MIEIPVTDENIEEISNNLKGGLGELRFTVQVTRKETGETETHELIGKPIEE